MVTAAISMSWSEGRDSIPQNVVENTDKLLEKLHRINGLMKHLSVDEDLQDDLKLPVVQVAINHWKGGANRLPDSEAKRLQQHRRVLYVFERLVRLQSLCKELNVKVPMDEMLSGSPHVTLEWICNNFGKELISHPSFPTPLYEEAIRKLSRKHEKANATQLKNKPLIESSSSKNIPSKVEKSEEKEVEIKKASNNSLWSIDGVLLSLVVVIVLSIVCNFYFSSSFKS